MAYTWTRKKYGSKPWQYLELGIPASGADWPTAVIVPGGGFGLRDPSPFMDATHPGAKPLIENGLMKAGGTYEETYAIAVLNVASHSHQGMRARLDDTEDWFADVDYEPDDEVFYNDGTGYTLYRSRGTVTSYDTEPDAYSGSVDYVVGIWVTSGGNTYRCILGNGPNTAAGVKATSDATYWEQVVDPDPWSAASVTYFTDDVVLNNSITYICTSGVSHVSAGLTEPGVGADWRDEWDRYYFGGSPGEVSVTPVGTGYTGAFAWEEVDANDLESKRVADRGDMTNGYQPQAVADIWAANSWLRRNAEELSLNGKLLAFGDSAGAYNVLQAIALGEAPFIDGAHPAKVNPGRVGYSTQFDAAILDICPAKWDLFCDPYNASFVQSQILSFCASLYGIPALVAGASWDSFPRDLKKAVDPYYIMRRTGNSVPIYFTTTASYWELPVAEADIYQGTVSTAPDVHHALHSKVMMELLTSDPVTGGSGGLGRDDCVHFEASSLQTTYRRHVAYPSGGNGTPGTHYTTHLFPVAQTWDNGTSYVLDDYVSISGGPVQYRCTVANSTVAASPDVTLDEWTIATAAWYRLKAAEYLGDDLLLWASDFTA